MNNTDDEDDDKKPQDDLNPNQTSTPKEPEKLYPTAPALDESSDNQSTASAQSTSV